MGRIADCRLDLRRAKEHLGAYDAGTEGYFDETLNRIGVERHAQPQDTYFLLKGDIQKPPDPMWGKIVGDFASNCREALDHIISNIERKRGGPGITTQFPIHTDSLNFPNSAKGRLGRLYNDTTFVAAVEAAQPYTRTPAAPDTDPLARLATINNAAKHSGVHAVNAWMGVEAIKIDGPVPATATLTPITTRVEHNAPLALVHIHYLRETGDVQVTVNGTMHIALYGELGQPISRDDEPVSDLLESIYNRVTEIVTDFEEKFA